PRLRKNSRIFQMPESDVVSSYGEPRAIWFRNSVRYFLAYDSEVASARGDVLYNVAAIGDAHLVCRLVRQNHHAQWAVSGFGERIPLRSLVADCGQQTPVNSCLRRRGLE